MGIFEQDDIVTQRAKLIRELANGLFGGLENGLNAAFNLLLNTPGVNPQDILDKIGADGGKLILAFGASQQLLEQLNPAYKKLDSPYEFLINPDTGAVTIVPKEQQEQEQNNDNS